MRNLVFVDCEANGPSPSTGKLTEIGAVAYPARCTFYADLRKEDPLLTFSRFDVWLKDNVKGRPIFVSDNPAYDFQWINDGFHLNLGRNPFGHSGRRISDFYAGLCRNFSKTQEWKRWRVTPHDHNPVNDAMGNVEAFEKILELAEKGGDDGD